MGKSKPGPRYDVVSMRVTFEEKEAIRKLSRTHNLSTSDLLRDAADRAGLLKGGNTE